MLQVPKYAYVYFMWVCRGDGLLQLLVITGADGESTPMWTDTDLLEIALTPPPGCE